MLLRVLISFLVILTGSNDVSSQDSKELLKEQHAFLEDIYIQGGAIYLKNKEYSLSNNDSNEEFFTRGGIQSINPDEVVGLLIRNIEMQDEDWVLLTKFDYLDYLTFMFCNIDDEKAKSASRLTKLRDLTFSDEPITGACFETLREMPNLKSICLL